MTELDPAVRAARDAFPSGLDQPENGYRFSLDPLLLAAFAKPKKNVRLVDLGCGCGVAALALLLLRETPGEALGLDINPAMAASANRNAELLGLADRFRADTVDIRRTRERLSPESFGLVLANPPYWRLGTGLTCQAKERTTARFENRAELDDFLAAASFLLKNRGSMAVVFPSVRLVELMSGCRQARLTPKRLKFVHSRIDEPAKLLLLEAVKNAGEELTVEAPLVLYAAHGEQTRMLPGALAYCPFLAKNP